MADTSPEFGGGSSPIRLRSSSQEGPRSSEEVWRKNPRQRSGLLAPLPFEGKPQLKTLEAEIHRQVLNVHDRLQQDMDHLHEQVHSEIHTAISKELLGVAQKIMQVSGSISGQVNETVRVEVDPLRTTVGQLCEEAKWMRRMREEDAKAAQEAAQQASQAVSAEVSAALGKEASAFQEELAAFRERLEQDLSKGQGQIEALVARIDGLKGEVTAEIQAEAAERQRLAESVVKTEGQLEAGRVEAAGALEHLEAALRSEAQVCEARFGEAQAAVAGLEQRQGDAFREALDALSGRVEQVQTEAAAGLGEEMGQLKERVEGFVKEAEERLSGSLSTSLGTASEELQRLSEECREGLSIAHASHARLIDWTAEVDLPYLEREGRCDVASPMFAAAGLRDLQLHLRVQAAKSSSGEGPKRWTCGVFLRAPWGKVAFRLQVAGRGVAFNAEFGEAPEWGSQKVAVLEQLGATLPVRLELLDVIAPVSVGEWPEGLSASMQHQDASLAASRETTALRSAMVRRVEWRVARVSERLAAARAAASSAADDEALEPLCSPPFAAAGFEGLQFQLYPLGYRPRGDEACGFFLTCPKGMYVKCRAFVGDAVRNFDHHYESREPYGRGSFCRLADKIDSDDCIVCGVEFTELRHEQTSQVRGGPFGNVADQLKIVTSPANGGMEAVRELREVPVGRAERKGRPRGQAQQGPLSSPLLESSKSLPMLLPMGASPAIPARPGPGAYPPSPARRQVDNWR